MLPHTSRWRFMLIIFFTALMLSSVNVGFSQTSQDDKNGYVVIGAFAIERNAQRLTASAKKKNIIADYKIHPTKDLYYVYREADNPLQERERILRAFPEFYDVWVYNGELGRGNLANSNIEETSKIRAGEVENVVNISGTVSEASSGVSGVSSNEEQTKKSELASEIIEEQENSEMTSTNEDVVEVLKNIIPKKNTYYLYLNTINSKNLKEVKGRVDVIDPVRAKQLKEAKSHRIVEVRDPNNGSKTIKLSTNIFGFREVQQTVNLDNPVNDTTSNYVHTIGDSIIVDFELQRYKKGDVLIMYNVYFYKDAAIMKPESIYELNQLLDMLKENENLVVRLHGHTNGKSHGKILHLDLEDKNFFSLNAIHKSDNGSAKQLSKYRAYTIQHWLMEQGIAEERIDIKGWGGKQMIFDKHDTQAFKNVRVEVEIVEE